jgi:hypothetical protein
MIRQQRSVSVVTDDSGQRLAEDYLTVTRYPARSFAGAEGQEWSLCALPFPQF